MEQDRIRFTISVEPEVHAAFSAMAEAAGQSLSRAVGDWLRDTTEASRFVAKKMRELRLSPAAAMKELQAYQEADVRRTEHHIAQIEAGAVRGARGERDAGAHGARRAVPPSSNTGGKGRDAKGPKR